MKISDATIEAIEIDEIGEFDSVKAGLSEESLEFILDSLTDGLYADKITAILREYTSNMEDAIKVENKLDKPYYIIFSKDIDTHEYWISFKDYGPGLSPTFMKNIFMNWGESTRRKENTGIGGFGIGSKSALAYSNEFYIITTVNGVTYEYILYKTGKLPELSLLNQYDSKEPNGTEIKIQIKESDYPRFIKGCNDLILFKNLVVVPLNNLDYNNDYQIKESDLFYITTKRRDYYDKRQGVYIANDPVIYFANKLELLRDNVLSSDEVKNIGAAIERINYDYQKSVILKAEIGELSITLSRDSLKYTKNTCDTIIDKILKTDEFLKKTIDDYSKNDSSILDNIKKNSVINSDILYKYLIDSNNTLNTQIHSHLKKKISYDWNWNIKYNNFKKLHIRHNLLTIINNIAYCVEPKSSINTLVLNSRIFEDNCIIDDTEHHNFLVSDYPYIFEYFSEYFNAINNADPKNTIDRRLCMIKFNHITSYENINVNYLSPSEFYLSPSEFYLSPSELLSFQKQLKKELKENFLCVSSVPSSYIELKRKESEIAKKKILLERAEKAKEVRRQKKLDKLQEGEYSPTLVYYTKPGLSLLIDIEELEKSECILITNLFESGDHRSILETAFADKKMYVITNKHLTNISPEDSLEKVLRKILSKKDSYFILDKIKNKKVYYQNKGLDFFIDNFRRETVELMLSRSSNFSMDDSNFLLHSFYGSDIDRYNYLLQFLKECNRSKNYHTPRNICSTVFDYNATEYLENKVKEKYSSIYDKKLKEIKDTVNTLKVISSIYEFISESDLFINKDDMIRLLLKKTKKECINFNLLNLKK